MCNLSADVAVLSGLLSGFVRICRHWHSIVPKETSSACAIVRKLSPAALMAEILSQSSVLNSDSRTIGRAPFRSKRNDRRCTKAGDLPSSLAMAYVGRFSRRPCKMRSSSALV